MVSSMDFTSTRLSQSQVSGESHSLDITDSLGGRSGNFITFLSDILNQDKKPKANELNIIA
jgi:hypothetical protein